MSDQQFVLRWHYHETTLLQNLPCMLDNEVLSDVTLSVGAQNLRAHKIILAMCSVYFLQLFQDLRNTTNPVVVLHNVCIEDIRAVLAFIYRGQCVVSKEQLPSLLAVAKSLKIQGLCDMKVPEKDIETFPPNIPPLKDYYIQPIPEKYLKSSKSNYDNIENSPLFCDIKNTESVKTVSPTTESYYDSNFNIRTNEDPKNEDEVTQATDLSSESRKRTAPVSPVWEKPSPVTPTLEPNFPIEDTSIPNNPSSHLNPFPPPISRIPSPKNKSTNPKEVSETCKCFLCGKYLSNQYNLRVHMETHEEAYHACQSCPHVSRSRDALRKHVSYRHPDEYQTRKRKKTDN